MDKSEKKMMAGLIGLGAVLNDMGPDGKVVPAVQYIDSTTGKPRAHICIAFPPYVRCILIGA